jgi:hypothetical protein
MKTTWFWFSLPHSIKARQGGFVEGYTCFCENPTTRRERIVSVRWAYRRALTPDMHVTCFCRVASGTKGRNTSAFPVSASDKDGMNG